MESLWTALCATALRACPQASHSLGLCLETAARSPHAPQLVICSIRFMAVGVRLRLPSLALRKFLLERTYRKDWTQLSQPPAEFALKKKRNCFSADLAEALEDDFQAQNNTPGEIVGIDYDPFLYSQDPARSYKAGQVVQKGDASDVSVHVARKGKLASKPSVIAVVKSINGKLVFTDFKSPSGRSLLAVLHSLKVGRNSPRK